MNIQNFYTPSFRARCPEVKLGQDICHMVNCEFPHYSMTKFEPIISKYIHKTKKPSAVMMLKSKLYCNRPIPDEEYYENYFPDLFNYIQKYHFFNCHESSLLSALVLKLNGFENVYTASVFDGEAEIDHAVCFFNRDGSEYNGEIDNNRTIVIDAWAGICDFANNIFSQYANTWQKYFTLSEWEKTLADGNYHFANVKKMCISQVGGFAEGIKNEYPNILLKNNTQKKR